MEFSKLNEFQDFADIEDTSSHPLHLLSGIILRYCYFFPLHLFDQIVDDGTLNVLNVIFLYW